MDRPIIVLSSGMVHHLDDDEMRFVIGHELGHAISGHAVYRTLLLRLLGLGGLLNAVPGGALGIRMVTVGLLEWSRKAELSADRAGLLASQDPTAALRTHMKIASGGTSTSSTSPRSSPRARSTTRAATCASPSSSCRCSSSRATRSRSSARPSCAAGSTPAPTPPILGGAYPRREGDDDASVSEAAQEAAASYAVAFERTQDTLGRLVHDLAGWMGTASTWLNDRFRPAGTEGRRRRSRPHRLVGGSQDRSARSGPARPGCR